MAIKFQYNKTSLQQLEKNLKMRQRTLPIIKNKESALRVEVKRCKEEVEALAAELEQRINACNRMFALWNEFDPSIVSIDNVEVGTKKVAGVKVPVLLDLKLKVARFSMFTAPKWYYDGIEMMRQLAKVAIEHEFGKVRLQLLDHTRRKTTQKVNLFEKVQIPGYQDAIRKIKRFMEDEENLSKSSQKILKTLQEKRKKVAEAAGKEAVA
ncbi:MAG: V-type ATP synthase subunit D [Bacteroidaceae bacterium]|nr:V-type ATP synthase subunit D [Bacteroidaceae bacterium]